jgi:hypothetical protein
MILPGRTREGDTYFYSTGLDRPVEQYLYASARPWFYMSSLAIAICRRTPNLKVVFFADDPRTADVVREYGDYYWCRTEDIEDQEDDEYDLVVSASTGTALFPATRWGLLAAPGLMYRTHSKRWCRLIFDNDFRRRLLDASLAPDDFLKEVEDNWVLGVWSDWDGIMLDMGPQFSRLDESVIEAAIAETNEQCI